jgi:hypothetical protein
MVIRQDARHQTLPKTAVGIVPGFSAETITGNGGRRFAFRRLDRDRRIAIAPGFYTRFIPRMGVSQAKDAAPMRTPQRFALFALTIIGAIAPAASAQLRIGPDLIGGIGPIGTNTGGTIIYWRDVAAAPNPSPHFKLFVNSSINESVGLYPNETRNPSAFSHYPNMGRQFISVEPLDPTFFGFIPGTDRVNNVVSFRSEMNSELVIPLTDFNGPDYLDRPLPHWSSDLQDTFLTFQAYDPVTDLRNVYRFDGNKSDLFSPFFTPFVSQDPRLNLVATIGGDSFINDWNSDGTLLLFSTPAPFGFVLQTYNPQSDTFTVVNDPAVSGFSLRDVVSSPNNPNLVFGIGETPGGARGLAFMNITTPNMGFGFLLLEGVLNGVTISNFSAPQVSPDARWLACTMIRTVPLGGGPTKTLVRVPTFGGGYQPLWTIGPGAVNNSEVTRWLTAP